MDWLEILYGRRRASGPSLAEYAGDPGAYPEIEAAGSLPGAVKRSAVRAQHEPMPETVRDARREIERRQGRGYSGENVVPFSAASAGSPEAVRPFGNDFDAWLDAVEAAERPRAPEGMLVQPQDEPVRFGWGLNSATGEGAQANAPREITAERRGLEPPDAPARPGFDPTREWIDVERRARGASRVRPRNHWDVLFEAIYGRRDGARLNEIERETGEFRARARNPRD